MSFNNVTIASAEETTAACITLSKNVKSEVEDTTYIYNGYKPNLGAKFTDSEKHSLVYYESRSVYDEESGKWSEASDFSEIVIGFASSLSEYAVTEKLQADISTLGRRIVSQQENFLRKLTLWI